jgi:hypothetical protein
MATIDLTLTIKRAWWVKPYLYVVLIFSHLTCIQPDAERVIRIALRGYRVTPKY